MDTSGETKQHERKHEDANNNAQEDAEDVEKKQDMLWFGPRAHNNNPEPRRHPPSHANQRSSTSPSTSPPTLLLPTLTPIAFRERQSPQQPPLSSSSPSPHPLRLPPILCPSHPSIDRSSSRGASTTTPPTLPGLRQLFSASHIGLFTNSVPQSSTQREPLDLVCLLLRPELESQQLQQPPLSINTSNLDLAAATPTPCGMPPTDDNTGPPLLSPAPSSPPSKPGATTPPEGLHYKQYNVEAHEARYMPLIRQLIGKDLSEPYSIYVYRYFLYQWADLCFMALDAAGNLVGVIICKLEPHRSGPLRGYIAMLAVTAQHRGQGIATKLVRLAIDIMVARDADEVALETEITNIPSLKLYESLGFLRSKRLHRYYLNGNAAFRLVLYLKPDIARIPTRAPEYPADEDFEASPLPASSTSQELAAANGVKGA